MSRFIVLWLIAGVMVTLNASAADAWNKLYCLGVGGTVSVYVTSNTAPTTDLMGAAHDWESGTSGFSFVKTTVESDRDVYSNNKDFGLTGWSGLTHDINDLQNAPQCGSNGRWTKSLIVSVNNYYHTQSGSKRQAVAGHEWGHYLGLAHEDTRVRCPEGGTMAIALMNSSDARFDGLCPIYIPTTDDKAGANANY